MADKKEHDDSSREEALQSNTGLFNIKKVKGHDNIVGKV